MSTGGESPSTVNVEEDEYPTDSARESIGPQIIVDTFEDLEADAEGILEDEEEEEDAQEEEEEEEGEGEAAHAVAAEAEEPEPEGYDDDDFKDDYFLEFREQFGPEETFKNLDSSNVQDLINMLAKVKLVWPEDLPYYDEHQYNSNADFAKFPQAFFHCSAKEKAVMWHAENFRRQFTHIFPDRRPLLIAPKNECGTQKLFPTFLHPTALGYPEFYDAESTGKFMKDFLSPQFFRPPTRVPRVIRSHVTVLKDRKANSFEASVIIASLLNGAGFDSYVVDGYATKEITTMCEREDFMDVEDEDAPLKVNETDFEFRDEEVPEEKVQEPEDDDDDDDFDVFGSREEQVRPVSPSKYKVKAPKEYFSQYEKAMDKRAQEKADEERLAAEKEAYEEMVRNQRPPTPDPLFGFRTHAWVMIMRGKRGVQESFFLEPFSGLRKEISDPNFLGIEAIFNEKNYYANIQDCSAGISDISYDLDDKSKWAKLLLEPPCRRSCKKAENEDDEEEDGPAASLFQEDDDEEAPPCEKYLDMPVSWTPELNIPQEDYEKKYPEGSKIKDYNDAFVEIAAPWVNSDGLIKKIIKFDGATRDPKRLMYIEERFAHRQDKLERRKWLKDGRTLHEFFEKGRKDSLKEHIHQSGKNKAHHPRHLYYYADAHPQNVSHREVVPNGLIEEFEGRDDLLYYRAIYYGGFLCHTIPPEEDPKVARVRAMLDMMRGEEHGNKSKPRKKILRIDEKYHRNPEIEDADQDIAEKYLFMAEGKIIIYFHYGKENFTRKSMEFFKPRGVKVDEVDFRPEDCVEYSVDPFSVPTSIYDRYLILKTLSKDELRAGSQARQAEDEIYHTVTQRIQEDWTHKMEASPYTQIEQLQQRKEGERGDAEEDLTGVDFATPYLEKYGKPATKRQEIALKQKIIKDARERIIKKAKAIQKEYDEESAKLKTKMEWYDRMKDHMSSEEDEEFHLFYNQALFKMHIMEQRLVRHREQAPIYFNQLLVDVLRHPVLNYFANRKISREEKQRRAAEQQAEEEERKRLEALAKIPKDICCEYRFKFADARKSKANTTGGATTLGGDGTAGAGDVEVIKAPAGGPGKAISKTNMKMLPQKVKTKLSIAMNRMSLVGAGKPKNLSRAPSKMTKSKKGLK